MTATATVGKIVQIIGPVIDVEFDAGHLPDLYNALEITGTSDTGDKISPAAARRLACRQPRANRPGPARPPSPRSARTACPPPECAVFRQGRHGKCRSARRLPGRACAPKPPKTPAF